MPIFVDPNAPVPAPPPQQTSPDGILTAFQISDGVLLRARFGQLPTLQNLAPNPSLSRGVDVGSATHEIDDSWSMFEGATSMKIISGGNAAGGVVSCAYGSVDEIGWSPGHTYTVSVYCRVVDPVDGDNTRRFKIRHHQDDGTIDTDYAVSDQVANTAGVYRTSITFTADAGDTFNADILLCNGSPTSGAALWFDWLLIEDVTYTPDDQGPHDYFSGDSPDDDDYWYEWSNDTWHSLSVARPKVWVDKVRFLRGDVPVRSGNDAWAIDGEAVAYDMEAPLGQVSTWTAIPIYGDGTEGPASEGVALAITKPDEPYNSWLKSIRQPGLSMRVFFTTESLPEWSYAARNNLSQIQGSPYPAGGRDTHMAAELTLSAYTDPDVDQQQMLALLTSGELLFQTDPDFNEPDFYFLPGDLTRGLASTMANGARKWTIPATVIARPTPYGAALWIPGRTLAETEQGTLAIRQSVYPLVGDTLGIPQEVTA